MTKSGCKEKSCTNQCIICKHENCVTFWTMNVTKAHTGARKKKQSMNKTLTLQPLDNIITRRLVERENRIENIRGVNKI